jgi:hypothetical protein
MPGIQKQLAALTQEIVELQCKRTELLKSEEFTVGDLQCKLTHSEESSEVWFKASRLATFCVNSPKTAQMGCSNYDMKHLSIIVKAHELFLQKRFGDDPIP